MRTKVLFTAISFLIATALSAETVFVKSARANLQSAAQSNSGKVASVTKGTRLNVKSTQGSWLNVTYQGKDAYVRKYFTSKTKPVARVSLLSSAKTNAMVHARKRASSDVTAASARGLMSLGSADAKAMQHARKRASSDVTAASARGLVSLGSADAKAMQHARKRSSSDVTAASARGLQSEEASGRVRAANDPNVVRIDPNALDKVEARAISEKDLLAFQEQGNLL